MQKYKLLKFLNGEHGTLLCMLFAGVGFLGTLFATHSRILASEIFYQYKSNNFKSASRRAGWYGRRFLNINIVQDDLYNFTEGLDEKALLVLEDKLSVMATKNDEDILILSDQLYIWSALMETDARYYHQYEQSFSRNASKICQIKISQKNAMTPQSDGQTRQADFSRDEARYALKDFSRMLPIDDWNWYVMSGTFLGLIREGGFLAHDYDIDVGINIEDLDLETLIEVINGHDNFVVRKIDYQNSFKIHDGTFQHLDRKIVLIKLVHVTNINIDIFIHHLENDVRWHGSSFHRWDNTEFSLKRYEYETVEVNGPVDADLYLTENYGDWRTPVVDFNCATGTPNLTLVPNPSSASLFLRRIATAPSPAIVDQNLGILRQAGALNAANEFYLLL